MTQHKVRVRIAISAVVLLALSCSVMDQIFDSNEPRLPLPEEVGAALQECNATSSLMAETTIMMDTVNEFGTRLCEYKLVVTNDHASSAVIPVLFVHNLDGYQNLDEKEWMPQGSVAPFTSTEWQGNVYTYTDPDATGPVAHVAERITGVLNTTECASMTSDDSMLELLSVELESAPCPFTK